MLPVALMLTGCGSANDAPGEGETRAGFLQRRGCVAIRVSWWITAGSSSRSTDR